MFVNMARYSLRQSPGGVGAEGVSLSCQGQVGDAEAQHGAEVVDAVAGERHEGEGLAKESAAPHVLLQHAALALGPAYINTALWIPTP